MKAEKPAAYYDLHFENEMAFQVHYKQSFYYVHWTQVIVFLRKIIDPAILEIGCGTGQLAEYLKDENFRHYTGFDFSSKAISLARERVDMPFFVGDALDPACYRHSFNTIICLEVLEHVQKDLEVLETLPINTHIIFSVPNFDAPSHVRWFTSERQVKKRYYRHVDLQEIIRVGNIYICRGIIRPFNPNILQRFFAARETVSLGSFTRRIRHRIKNTFKTKA
jgi:2-polyprenyl-3-methyl-5-hydroxy-6-metoxy-1,4-benzoquinol methylase